MATEHIPTDGPVLIVTASYEGEPADNARHFVAWLEGVAARDAFEGTRVAVFGCGNREWARTYQRIPTLVDAALGERGAERVVERGEGDAVRAEGFLDSSEDPLKV